MKDIFETSVYELCDYLRRLLLSAKPGDEIRILDWTDSLNNDNAYWIFEGGGSDGKCAEESLCQLPVNIDSFCNESTYESTYDYIECLKFNNISLRDVKDNSYDLVVLRHMTERDNGIDDVIKRIARALKDDGVLYTNLVITSELELIFKSAEKYGLDPVAASKIILNDLRPEYYFRDDGVAFTELYDMRGYIQLAFKKGKCEKFRYTEASDKNYKLMSEEQAVIWFKDAAFDGIWSAITGEKCGAISDEGDTDDYFSADQKKWIISSEEIDIERVKEFFTRMKEDSYDIHGNPYFPESEKIRFSDYFEVDTPHHKNLSELDTSTYYYLSPSNPIHCLIDNSINSDKPSVPDDVLMQINLNNMGNIYDLIDDNSEIIAASERWRIGKWGQLKGKNNFFETKPIKLDALNNIVDAGIDIKGTLLYNLIRIRPKGKITLDYLKMFFYVDKFTRDVEVRDSNNSKPYSHDEICRMREDVDFQAGRYAINDFSELHLDSKSFDPELNPDENGVYHYTEYATYTADEVRSAYIYVDDFKKHKKMIERFKQSQDMAMAIVHKRFADVAFLDNLHKCENEAKARYDNKTVVNLINLEEQLALGEQNYEACLNHNKNVSLQYHFVAVEIYLKLRLACCKNKEEIYCGKDKYIEDVGEFSLWDLLYIYSHKDNKHYLFKKDMDEDKYNSLLQRLSKYRSERNKPSHRYHVVKAAEAEDTIKEIYDTLLKDVRTSEVTQRLNFFALGRLLERIRLYNSLLLIIIACCTSHDGVVICHHILSFTSTCLATALF